MKKIETTQMNSDFIKNLKKMFGRKSKDPFEKIYKDLKRETDKYLQTEITKSRISNDR
jgi:hypothetical protein